MRKLLVWFLVALMALSGFALAETVQSAVANNGRDVAHVGTDYYMAIPDGTRQMLVRVPAAGSPTCVDRADRFEDLMPYGNGVAYLKTENGSSTIMSFNGASLTAVYGLGSSSASALSYYDGKLLVLIDSLLHSIEPATQLCLRLSSTPMLDYVIDGDTAYFLSGGDRMEYTATLDDGQTVSAQAGCVYSMDLNSGSTTLLLKSGGRDLQLADGMLYFHNLADAYAVVVTGLPELRGHVNSLDLSAHTLGDGSTEADNGFWALTGGLVVWYNGALNMDTEAGTIALYTPETDATVGSDGEALYIWEPGKQTLTQVQLNGTQKVLYTGNLTQSVDISPLMPVATVPSASASADPNNALLGGVWTQATPIGATATPAPQQSLTTFAPAQSSGNSGAATISGTTTSGSTYAVDISYVRITGGTVNVRSKAGTNYSILGTLSKGSVAECTGWAAKDSGNNTWYQIWYYGSKGWVSAGYAKKTSEPDSSYVGPEEGMGGGSVTITGASVNVRALPNLSGASLGVVKKGTTLSFLGRRSTDSRGVDWYKISYRGGTGWVSSRYSVVNGTSGNPGGGSGTSGTLYTTGAVNVRTGPGLGYSSIGNLPRGTAFRVSYKQRDGRGVTWYMGTGGGLSGWVSSANLTNEYYSDPGTVNPGVGSETSGTLYTSGVVNVRTGPGLGYKSKGNLPRGTAFSVNYRQSDARGVVWYRGTGGGMSGWISSAYLSGTASGGSSGGSGSGGSGSSTSGTLYTTGTVNVRSGPGLDYGSRGNLPRGTSFSVDYRQSDARGVVWYRGTGGGLSGWVSSAYLSSSYSGGSSSGSSGGSSGGGSRLVTTGQVTVRSQPNKTSASLGYVPSGKTVTYLNNSQTDSRGVVWYYISYNGLNGWISSMYSTFK